MQLYRRYLYLLFLALTFLAYNCKNDDDDDNDDNPPPSMDALIDLTEWSSVQREGLLTGGVFIITGMSEQGDIIEVVFMGDTVGTYKMDTIHTDFTGAYKPDSNATGLDTYVSSSGIGEINKINSSERKISGTFSFIAAKDSLTKEITNGTFVNIEYTE